MYSRPAKVNETVKIVTEVKEVESTKEDGTIHEKEIKHPDGTVEITRIKGYTKVGNRIYDGKTLVAVQRSEENLPTHQFTVVRRLGAGPQEHKYSLGYGYRIFSTLYLTGFTNSFFDEWAIGVTWGF